MPLPSRAEFERLAASGRPLIFTEEILADFETPLGAYWKLAHDEEISFLLESVTGGEQVGRYSYIGIRPRKVLRIKNGRHRDGTPLSQGQDPLHVLDAELPPDQADPVAGLPAFRGGAVTMLGYDIVRSFERLPNLAHDDLDVDDLAAMIVDTLVVFDHARNVVRVLTRCEPNPESYEEAVRQVESLIARLEGPMPKLPRGAYPRPEVGCNMTKERFCENVTRMVELIGQGDGVQMVPSQRFQMRIGAHPLTVYRALRSINPSPYMFLLRFGDFDLVGASPELLVSLHDGCAKVRPIAGTRKRGESEAEDEALADELIHDQKERAEHIMLVDLGRNDLGRVCQAGTVTVKDLMVIERYSHVMHIVSSVEGQLRTDKSGYDLVRAVFPAGTVSGAPKVRAMQVIEELEPTRRGAYAGSVGTFSRDGGLDLCITLRSILIKDGMAYVQAGGGVVYDSKPELEYEESRNKAKASLRALEMAQAGL